MVPSKETEESLADANIALLARLLSKGLKQYKMLMDKHETTMLIINQLRAKPGVMYGPTETLTSGNALKYYSDIILKVSRTKIIEKGKQAIGIISKLKTTKNRCAPPFREKEIHIMFPHEEDGVIKVGIDLIEDLIPEAISQKVIEQRGASYTWRGNKIHSKDKVIEYFKSDPNLLELLREDLMNNNQSSLDTEISEKEIEEINE